MNIKVNDEIVLEQIKESHTKELFSLVEINRNHLREWLPWVDYSNTLSDIEFFVNRTIDQFKEEKGPQYVIFYKGEMCGVAGFHPFDLQNRIGGIGYWLGKSFSGLGIMTLVVAKLVALGFDTYNLNKIEIGCAENNEKSKAIPLRLGFTLEATLREQERLYDKYVNQCLFTKLQSEYNA